jgi:hypothetical protein
MSRCLSPNNPVRATIYAADGSKIRENQFSYEYDAEGKPGQESRTTLQSGPDPVRNPTPKFFHWRITDPRARGGLLTQSLPLPPWFTFSMLLRGRLSGNRPPRVAPTAAENT